MADRSNKRAQKPGRSLAQAAFATGIPIDTLRRMLQRREVEGWMDGRNRYFVAEREIERLCQQRKLAAAR